MLFVHGVSAADCTQRIKATFPTDKYFSIGLFSGICVKVSYPDELVFVPFSNIITPQMCLGKGALE